MFNKRIYIDFIFNIIASVLPIAFLQLIMYPFMAKYLDAESYGEALIIISFTTIIIQVSGIGINNTRIIKQEMYSKNKEKGDFNVLLLTLGAFNIIACLICLRVLNFKISKVEVGLLICLVEFGLLKTYISAEYNINKDFKKVLYSNMFLIAGYILGVIVFLITRQWIFMLLLGNVIATLYMLKTTCIWKEKLKITIHFKEISSSIFAISFSSLLINLVTYADRLILFPLVGASQVAVYYTASVFGKILSMGLSPISSVLLSYFSKESEMNNKKFWKMNIANFAVCIAFYIVSRIISEPIVKILYPDLFVEVRYLINIANIAAIINASTILVQPTILKFCNLRWQIYIQIIHLVIYILFSLLIVPEYGIIGFAYITVFIAIVKLGILLLVGTISFNKNKNVHG